ncbi:MAG: hypothetical protein ACLUKN_04200 [Bacilli bacterium]
MKKRLAGINTSGGSKVPQAHNTVRRAQNIDDKIFPASLADAFLTAAASPSELEERGFSFRKILPARTQKLLFENRPCLQRYPPPKRAFQPRRFLVDAKHVSESQYFSGGAPVVGERFDKHRRSGIAERAVERNSSGLYQVRKFRRAALRVSLNIESAAEAGYRAAYAPILAPPRAVARRCNFGKLRLASI